MQFIIIIHCKVLVMLPANMHLARKLFDSTVHILLVSVLERRHATGTVFGLLYRT